MSMLWIVLDLHISGWLVVSVKRQVEYKHD